MGVDGGVSGGACQALVLFVRNVLMGAIIPELFGQAEVDGEHQVALLAEAHQEVVRLDIAVDKVLAMNELYSADLRKIWSCLKL